jgi:N-ethylmaleimide reductase
VAPSAIAAKTKTFIETGFADTSEARALSEEEIASVIADYRKAAENAKRAGFDGIEIHGANGYLIDQFLKAGTNKRTDRYGQSIENRARFALEVTNAILTVWDRSRVGIRLSPVSPANDAVDSNPEAIFFYLIEQLSARKLAYIHVIEGAMGGPRDNVPFDFLALRKAFAGAYIANNDYTRDLAIATRARARNPDLVERLRKNAPL